MFGSLKAATAKIIIVGALIAATIPFAQAAKPLEGQTLRVAAATTPPFVTISKDSLNNISGIDVDMILELQRRTGFKIAHDRLDIMNFGDMSSEGEKGNYDIMAGAIYLNDRRAKIYDFSEPYYLTSIGVFTRKGAGVKNFLDLNNRTIAAVNGTSATEAIPRNLNISVREVATPTSFMSFYSVASKEADATIADVPVGLDFIDNLLGQDMELAFIIPNTEANMGLLFKKGERFVPALQMAMREMILDGTAAKIVAKYSSDAHGNIAMTHYKEGKVVQEIAKVKDPIGVNPADIKPVKAYANNVNNTSDDDLSSVLSVSNTNQLKSYRKQEVVNTDLTHLKSSSSAIGNIYDQD